MADEHNPDRYGETWDATRIAAYLKVANILKPFVVFSGGWAWHFLSRQGHVEYKHAHDHKDLDLMVPKGCVGTVVGMLKGLGFEKVKTKYDRLPSAEEFLTCEGRGNVRPPNPMGARQPECCTACKGSGVVAPFRLTIDFFVKDVDTLQTPGDYIVVRPDVLVSYYSTIHSSSSCWAVVAAKKLLDAGATPFEIMGDPHLMLSADLDCYFCTKCGWGGQFPEMVGIPGKELPGCGNEKCGYLVLKSGKPKFQTMDTRLVEGVKALKELER